MRKCRITVMRKTSYPDLSARYEKPLEHACEVQVGQVWTVEDPINLPEGMCPSAWQTLQPFVMALMHGAENFYDGWMQNPRSAMLACNDGFRPVSFYLEALDA